MNKSNDSTTTDTPLADAVLSELGQQMPFLLRATQAGSPPLKERMGELETIAQRLTHVYGSLEKWLSQTVHGYVVLSVEFLKLQKQLEETGRYLYGSEREALQAAYDNEDVFGDYYLPGLLLSEALWPNHFLLNRGFQEDFLPNVTENAKVLEIGVGTGYHCDLLFKERPGIHYTGFDISEFAVSFAKQYAQTTRHQEQCEFVLGNVSNGLPFADNSLDAIVMGEVLEHIEDPATVLQNMRQVLKPEGCAFITTVAFAANIDHIYMFENVREIRDILEDNGWSIENDMALPVYPTDTPDMSKRPMNYGALIRPRP